MSRIRSLPICFFWALVCAAQSGALSNDLLKKAQAGDAAAQFDLGQAYEDGKGVSQDDDAAATWYRKAADQGNAKAENALGVLYSLGRGVPRNKEEAFRWYKKAARQGLPEADYNVAISYYNGDGIGSDLNRAYAWACISLRHGATGAVDVLKRVAEELTGRVEFGKNILAQMYEKGDETPTDLKAAFEVYKEMAEAQGQRPHGAVSEPELKVCKCYATGMGVQQDLTQAYQWCKKAARDGQPSAFIILGRMAEQGQGTEKNLNEAEIWYQDAAVLRFSAGFMELGRLKLQSNSHDDQRDAYFWLYLAQLHKISGAEEQAQKAAANLNDNEVHKEQQRAVQWLRAQSFHRDKPVFP
jgi:TPR repeat protein